MPEKGFAVSFDGVEHILTALAKGHRIDGKPVLKAVVIFVARDPTGGLRCLHQSHAEEVAEKLKSGPVLRGVGRMVRASRGFKEVVPAEMEQWN